MIPLDSSTSSSSSDDDDFTRRHSSKKHKKNTQSADALKVFVSKSSLLLRILTAEDSSASEDENPQDFGTSGSEDDTWDCGKNSDSDEQEQVEVQPPQPKCEKGHLACGSCCSKINNKCPRCSMQIGYNRCRGMEMVLESITSSCQNVRRGCLEKLSYSKKLEHEKTCKYASIMCPLPGCKFINELNSFYYHFCNKHSYSSFPITLNTATYLCMGKDVKQFLLIESDEKVFFIFNRVVDPRGSFVNVTCIAPTISGMKFSYDLTAKNGEKSVILKSSVELRQQPSSQPAKDKCLLISNEFHEVRKGLKTLFLDLVIRKVR